MGVTIKDIAEKANVSITTVSMIINNKGDSFSEETRKKVLEIVKEMNYKPNALARSLVTKKTKTIGLILPDITNPFYPEIARAIEDVANSLGYNLILCNTDNKVEKEIEYIEILKEKYVDGIIFTTSSFSNTRKFKDTIGDIPILILDENLDMEYTHGVFVDNIEGGYLAGKHLLDLGHRNIACITGPLVSKNSLDRLKGLEKAFLDYGFQIDENLIIEGSFKVESGMEAIDRLKWGSYTALFASNDMMAYGAYKALKGRGIRIPEDISIVGFDDLVFSQILEPGLTTIRQPTYKIGLTAIQILIDLIEEKNIDDKIIIYKPELIIRDSTKKIGS